MLFNSFEFLIFFPAVVFLYFLLPHKLRCALLLVASCIFYMTFIPAYILILFFTIIIDYIAGLIIESASGSRRRFYLAISIFSNVGVLAIFKYYGFMYSNIEDLAAFLRWNYQLPYLEMILPIGLSFHTFQAMSYTTEVFRGNQRAERNLGTYALYVMFFPQLVAGPIERPQNMLPQFYKEHYFDYDRVTSGLRLMVWGLFKKVVIADRLALLVNEVYGNPTEYKGFPLIIATIFFAFQIYCDFSGYSDIAIGAARVLGFRLMTNFDRPYSSQSITEFWRRWHISLSTWLRDYLYIPLGGNRAPPWRRAFNLFLTFLVSGLWHGAAWTFVVWGALHGMYMVLELWTRGVRQTVVRALGLDGAPWLLKYLQIILTFALVSFAWIFFRANSLEEAIWIVGHLLTDIPQQIRAPISDLFPGMTQVQLLIAISAILFMECVQYFQDRIDIQHWFIKRPMVLRWGAYYGMVFVIIFSGVFNDTQFIYFQF